MPMLTKTPLYAYWKSKIARRFKSRRMAYMLDLMAPYIQKNSGRPLKILEIGCSNGADAIRFLDDRWQVWGVDLLPQTIEQPDVTFVQADAETLPFEDDFFDIVISIGLLEHIEPMEKMSRVLLEARRVGRAYVHVMPCVSTFFEPHTLALIWPRRQHRNYVEKRSRNIPLKLNFFSDHTWTKFQGFADADIKRFWYIAPFIRNVAVYYDGVEENV